MRIAPGFSRVKTENTNSGRALQRPSTATSPHTLLHNLNLLFTKALKVVDYAVDFAGRGVQKKIA